VLVPPPPNRPCSYICFMSAPLSWGCGREAEPLEAKKGLVSRADLQPDRSNNGAHPLTPREWEVVELLAGGYDTRAIAERLHLSIHTVRNYVRNAREKLHAPSRLALVLAAQRLCLLQPSAIA